MRPKSLVISFIYSAFTSSYHFHEWNRRATAEQLVRINDDRCGSSYVSVDVANKVNRKASYQGQRQNGGSLKFW